MRANYIIQRRRENTQKFAFAWTYDSYFTIFKFRSLSLYNDGGIIDEHELYDYRILTTKIEIV